MTEKQRIRKVLQWLALCGWGDNDQALRVSLRYKNKGSFSQIINHRVPLSDLFIERLKSLDQNVNEVWIRKEEGAMLKSISGVQKFKLVDCNSLTDTNPNDMKTLYRKVHELTDKILDLERERDELQEKLNRLGGDTGNGNNSDQELQPKTG